MDLDKANQKANTSSDVIVASVATLGRCNSQRLQRLDPNLFNVIIIDEAHHAAAASYKRILDHFGALKGGLGPLVWGCSATVQRHDRQSLHEIFDEITFHKDFLEMIKEGW